MIVQSFLSIIHSGGLVYHSAWHSLCGKLQWYSGVIQRGRLWLRSLWHFKATLGESERHNKAGPGLLVHVVRDLECWNSVLDAWAEQSLSGREIPIISMKELAQSPNAIYYLQTDASGEAEEGRGGFYGPLSDPNPEFVSLSWGNVLLPSSQYVEIHTLLDILQRLEINQAACAEAKILLWATDASSAVFAVNAGVSRSDPSFYLLLEIYTICEIHNWQLIAIWIPRTSNTLPDLLSHLAPFLRQEAISGRIEDFA